MLSNKLSCDLSNNQRHLFFAGLCLLILVFIAYWPSFFVPFYLDDRVSIVENSLLTQGSIIDLFHHYGLRFIAYLSFWLNEQWFAGSLLSYHSVNFTIHCLNAVLIYLVVRKFIDCTQSTPSDRAQYIVPLCIAGIWLLHPLNIQAVTYIVQRTAALVTTFALITILSYLQCVTDGINKKRVFFFVIAAICGFLTKQNFIVALLFLVLFNYAFISTARSKNTQLGFLFTGVMLWAITLPMYPDFYTHLSALTKETIAISRIDYFTTQLIVLWLYIGKLLLPTNLQLDMGIELVKSSTGWHFTALLAHLLLIMVAVISKRVIPLFSIGILWFYVGHSVESFVIPITDLAFEHRTYLPNIGLIIAFISLLHYLQTIAKVKLKLIWICSLYYS